MWLGGGLGNGHLDLFDRTVGKVIKHFRLSADSTRWGYTAYPIMQVHKDKFGLVWFVMDELAALNRKTEEARIYVHNPQDPGSMGGGHARFCEDATGTLWIATDNGLDRFERSSNTFYHVPMKDRLASDHVCCMLEDNSGSSQEERRPGNLWLLTALGISEYTPSTGAIRNFGPAEGIPVAPSTYIGACFKSRSGYLYFGGTNGFVRFHPDSVKVNTWIPPIALTGFKKFNVDAELDSGITVKKAVNVSYAENVISFEFAALNYTRPEENQYAYKLEGFDRDWVYCGTRHTATYTNLDPASYVFRVKGSNNDGLWNEVGASLTVVVTPAYWQTWWFKTGLVIVFGLILYVLFRYRLSKVLELQRIRLRIADDLHDHIGSELSGLALESDLIARQMPSESPQHVRLEDVGRSIRRAADNLRDVVWIVNPERDTATDLVARMRAIAAKMLADHRLTFTSSESASQKSLDLEFKRHLVMMFKEILNNILRHARATHVHIEIQLTDERLRLSVADDGIGFTPSSRFTGVGLASLRTRAAAIGGDLTLESTPGSGTRVHFEAKITRSGD